MEESNGGGSVVNIKKGKSKAKGDMDKLSATTLKTYRLYDVKEMINKGALGFRCYVIDDGTGIRKPIFVNDINEAKIVADDYIFNGTIKLFEKYMEHNPEYALNAADGQNIVKIWKASDPIALPKKLAWQSDNDLCFKRLPFDFVKKISYSHPTWDLVLASIKQNKDYFEYFIGSIFEERSSNQGYLWLFGSGRNAKGAVLRFLKDVLGDVCKSSDVPDDNNRRFFTMKLEGKRVCTFPDVTDFGFVRTGFWKQLTGGDTVDVEVKGGGFYDLQSDCKFIVASNDAPEIKSSRDDMRRVVFVEFTDMEDVESFEEKLKQEAHEFICACVDKYRTVFAPLGFPSFDLSNNQVTVDLAEEYEHFFDGIFEKYFEYGNPSYLLPARTLDLILDRVFHGSSRKKKDFKSWFRRKHHRDPSVTVRYEDKPCKCYIGFKKKDGWQF